MRAFTSPSTRMTHSPRTFSAASKAGESGIGDDLGNAVMVAQVDEEQPAMVADAMDPARQADGLPDFRFPQLCAGVAAVTVHVLFSGKGVLDRPLRQGARPEIRAEKRMGGAVCQGSG